jgi:LuxR family maltose regulon positive regulatory protein
VRDRPPQAESEPGTTGDGVFAARRFGTPTAPSDHVPRPHLTAVLDKAAYVPLVLVSAPAGTGKTTLVADWVRATPPGRVCWVAFEDSELSFWDQVLESLRRQGLGVPTSWRTQVGSGLGHHRLRALAGLVIGAAERLTVVVDGYELASLPLAREVDYLLGHSLGRLCLVLVGRTDPVLPLYRYRLGDAVLEVRAPELAFSDHEAAQLLKSTGVTIDESAVHDLNTRLGGWAAGLRFAARALADEEDAGGYVATVVEQTRDINEYLVGEVLDAQPVEVRRFLLETCTTEVFSGDLVERVGGPGARRTMGQLVDGRLFVEPVSGVPDTFHYYPFFRSLLLAVLSYESPDRLVEIRRVAAGWHRDHERSAESLGQLAMVGDWRSVAAQVVEDGLVPRLLLEDRGGRLAEVVRRLPVDLDTPEACVVRAAVAVKQGGAGRERSAAEMRSARRALHGRDPEGPLAEAIAVTDAVRACRTEPSASAAAVVARAERVVRGTAEDWSAPLVLSGATALVALARGVVALRLGDLADARAVLTRVATWDRGTASSLFRADCLGHLAVVEALRGELDCAVQHAEEALTLASSAGLGPLDVPPSAHVALAWTAVERCDVEATTRHVVAARASRSLTDEPFCRDLVEAALATIEQSTGRSPAAVDRLQAAVGAAAARDPWIADFLRLEAARINVRDGEPGQALELLESAQLPDRPELCVAAAAAGVEQGVLPGPEGLPVRSGDEPLGTQLRALLVEATRTLHEGAAGRSAPALARALRLAEPEHLRRPFHDGGASVRQLLSADPRLVQEHAWLHRIDASGRSAGVPTDQAGLPVVVDALTAKELEVLGHLAQFLTTDEIALRMFVSVNTVRTHIRHILNKLGVNRRNAAIRRARELGILGD